MTPRLRCACTVVAFAALSLTARVVRAEDGWLITGFSARDAEPSVVQTFRDLVRDELQGQRGAPLIDAPEVCADLACARAAGAAKQAGVAIQGSVARLGSKLIVSVSAIEVGSGEVVFSQRMTLDRVEDLEPAAKRLGTAMVSGKSVDETAELGTITHQEVAAPIRRDTRVAALLHLGGVGPLSGYADRQMGADVAVGIFIETMDFVIEPSLGYRFDLSTDPNDYEHIALDIALSYLLSRGDVAPLLGLGVGLHYLSEDTHVSSTAGSVLVSRSTRTIEDRVAGFVPFLRAGFLLLRTYDVSVVVAIDYALTFADFEERGTEQSLRLGMNLVLGGT